MLSMVRCYQGIIYGEVLSKYHIWCGAIKVSSMVRCYQGIIYGEVLSRYHLW